MANLFLDILLHDGDDWIIVAHAERQIALLQVGRYLRRLHLLNVHHEKFAGEVDALQDRLQVSNILQSAQLTSHIEDLVDHEAFLAIDFPLKELFEVDSLAINLAKVVHQVAE